MSLCVEAAVQEIKVESKACFSVGLDDLCKSATKDIPLHPLQKGE